MELGLPGLILLPWAFLGPFWGDGVCPRADPRGVFGYRLYRRRDRGSRLHGRGYPFVEEFTPLSSVLAPLAAGLLIFLAVFISITLVTSTLAKSAHQSTEIGSFDRAAGLAFGVLRGVLVVALRVLLLRQAPQERPRPPSNASPVPRRVRRIARSRLSAPDLSHLWRHRLAAGDRSCRA